MKTEKSKLANGYILLELLFFLHIGIIGATYVLYFYNQGYTKLETNLLSGVFTISVFVFEIPSGAYCDLFGHRKTLIYSGYSLLLSMILFYIGRNTIILALGQILWGVSYALQSGALEAWVVDRGKFRGSELDKLFSKSQKISNIFMIIGGIIGTGLATISLFYIWIIPIASAFAYIILVCLLVDENSNNAIIHLNTKFAQGINSLKANTIESLNIIKTSSILKYLISFNMLIGFAFSPIFVFWSPYISSFKNGELWILAWMWALIKLFNAIGNTLLECFCTRFDRYKVLLASCITLCIVLITAGIQSNLIFVICMLLLFELLLGIVNPIQKSYLNDNIQNESRATILSFNSMFSRLGSFLSLIIMGYLGDVFSIGTTWCISGVILAASTLILIRIKELEECF